MGITKEQIIKEIENVMITSDINNAQCIIEQINTELNKLYDEFRDVDLYSMLCLVCDICYGTPNYNRFLLMNRLYDVECYTYGYNICNKHEFEIVKVLNEGDNEVVLNCKYYYRLQLTKMPLKI